MSWNTLLPNQCISFNNLQDAANLGLFLVLYPPLPVSNEQITKQDFEDYILVPDSVTNYPPFANKAQNQLLVKNDVAIYGNATLVPNYGISFTGVYYYDFAYQVPVGIWSLPASSTQTSQYYSSFGVSGYSQLYVEVDGNSTSPSGYFSVTLSVNGSVVSDGTFYSASGPQYTIVFLDPQIIYAPNSIELTIIDGQTNPFNFTFQDQNGGIPIVAVSANRGSGQYQMVATGSAGLGLNFLEGSLYRSIDYGATWQKSSNNTLAYWQRIAMSDTGQYMIASSLNGPLMLSSNSGASFTNITTRIRGNSTEYFEGTGMSGNGQYIIVCYELGGSTYTTKISNNYGAAGSWSVIPGISYSGAPPIYQNGYSIQGVAISNTGQYIYLSYSYTSLSNAGTIVKSSDYGATWQTVYPGTQYVRDISCSSDGSTVIVTGAISGYGSTYLSRGYMYKSTDYGVTYTSITSGDSLRNWYRVGQLYTSTSPSGYGTVMTYAGDYSSQVTDPSETYPVGGDSLGSVVLSNVTGMGLKVFTDCAVGGTNGIYRLLGSTTGLFRSTNGGGSWTQL
jgi:photosystem II stability/assembly factor-like uncharacterized protein